MLPVQQMFGGGAMNPTPGMAMNPLLQGFGSYQAMQDQNTNTQLNQQSQDIQNQQQQNVLQQSLLDNPNITAQRGVTAGNIGIQQGLIDSGQAGQAASAGLDAKTQAALAQMSDSKLEIVKDQSAAYVQASEFAKVNPEASMPGTQAHKQMLKMLTDADIKDVPDLAGPQEMNLIHTRAQAAVPTMEYIRQAQLAQGAQKSAEKIEGVRAAAQTTSAALQGENAFYSRLFAMPANERQINTIQIQVSKQVDDKGNAYMTPNQVAAAEAIVREHLAPADTAQAQSIQTKELDADKQMDRADLQKKAQRAGIPIKASDGSDVPTPELANHLASMAYQQYLKTRVDDIVKSQFPAAKNVRADLPAADVSPQTLGSPQNPPPQRVAGGLLKPTQAPGVQAAPPGATAATANQDDQPPVGGPKPQATSPGPADPAAYKTLRPGTPYKGIDGHLYIKGG